MRNLCVVVVQKGNIRCNYIAETADIDGVVSFEQISREELETALGFLREQLGEPELRRLLEELCGAAEKDSSIDVEHLMQMANNRMETQENASDSAVQSSA